MWSNTKFTDLFYANTNLPYSYRGWYQYWKLPPAPPGSYFGQKYWKFLSIKDVQFCPIFKSIDHKFLVQNLCKYGLIYVSLPQEAECFNTTHLYNTDANLYNSSINTESFSFFSSSDTRQSQNLLGCHTTGINSSFDSFLSVLRFPNLVCSSG